MKKNIKYLLSLSIVFSFLLSSCSDDGYSLGDMYISLAKVNVNDNGYGESFTLDNGQTLFVAATATSYKPKNERVVINYTILGDKYYGYDHAIKLNAYQEDILTKAIINVDSDDEEKQAEIGHDKIKVHSVWAKSGYINIRFAFLMGGIDQHLLNLVEINNGEAQDANAPLKLQFRHNKNKDEENYLSRNSHVCFKLDEYLATRADKDEIEIEVSWTEYDGTEKKELIKYTVPETTTPPVEEVEE